MVNKKALISLFIAFIMVFSIFGFIVDFAINPSNSVKYGKYKFKQVGDGWEVKYNGEKLKLYSTPQELENIDLSNEIKSALKNTKHIYLTYDLDDVKADVIGQVVYHTQKLISQATNINIERGLIDPKEYSLPKIDCTNADVSTIVILLKNLNETKISLDNNCIIFGSNYEFDYLRYAERLIYTTLGIME